MKDQLKENNEASGGLANKLFGCIIFLLVCLHACNTVAIFAGLDLKACWIKYTKSEVETICGSKYSKFIWESEEYDTDWKTTPATLGLGLAIVSIVAVSIFLVNSCLFCINSKFNKVVWALWFLTMMAQFCCGIYTFYYWEHMGNISKWCSDTDNVIKDENDEIQDYFFPFTIIWTVFAAILFCFFVSCCSRYKL